MSIDEERAPTVPALFRLGLGFGIPGKFLENSKLKFELSERSWYKYKDNIRMSFETV
jgi:hypothetical protein